MTSDEQYSDKLAWFKEHERPEAVLLIAGDPERIKIVVAWTNLDVRRSEKLTTLKDSSEGAAWKWLWENTRYSKEELIDKIRSGLSESGLQAKLKPLAGNRIIYPDGTVNSFVQRYLRDQVLKLFDAKPEKPRKAPVRV